VITSSEHKSDNITGQGHEVPAELGKEWCCVSLPDVTSFCRALR